MSKEKRIVLFGAGNLASHLGPALHKNGYQIIQVISRNLNSASLLAAALGAQAETNYSNLINNADYYLICVSDSQVENVILASSPQDKFIIHTSGSTSIDVLSGYCLRYGVLYPLQTFSKGKTVNMREVPFFVEASSPAELTEIFNMASAISDHVAQADSVLRLYLHTCAVFTCAFANHMYRIAEEICKSKDIPFQLLHPLLLETAEKASLMSPALSQTGPAARNDQKILKKHLDLLEQYPDFRKIYTFVSSSILQMNGYATDFLNTQPVKDE